jgi:hypothetical protein
LQSGGFAESRPTYLENPMTAIVHENAYFTTDGARFESSRAARAHQAMIDLEKLVVEIGLRLNYETDDTTLTARALIDVGGLRLGTAIKHCIRCGCLKPEEIE